MPLIASKLITRLDTVTQDIDVTWTAFLDAEMSGLGGFKAINLVLGRFKRAFLAFCGSLALRDQI